MLFQYLIFQIKCTIVKCIVYCEEMDEDTHRITSKNSVYIGQIERTWSHVYDSRIPLTRESWAYTSDSRNEKMRMTHHGWKLWQLYTAHVRLLLLTATWGKSSTDLMTRFISHLWTWIKWNLSDNDLNFNMKIFTWNNIDGLKILFDCKVRKLKFNFYTI